VPWLCLLPDAHAHFVPPFGVFPWAGLSIKTARAIRTVLMHSSNRYPQGNCDSFRPETSLHYLTQLGTASSSFLAAQFLLRVTGGARTPPEELVNTASASDSYEPSLEGPNQPAWLNLSPVTRDHPWSFSSFLSSLRIEALGWRLNLRSLP